MRFPKLEADYERASEALVRAINKEFPVGSIVTYLAGKGRTHGKVTSETWTHNVVMQNLGSGNRLSRDFRQIEHAE